MTEPEPSDEVARGRQILGEMLARVLDNTGDEQLVRAVVIYETLDTEGDEVIQYEGTEDISWTEVIGLLRRSTLEIERESLSELPGDDDE